MCKVRSVYRELEVVCNGSWLAKTQASAGHVEVSRTKWCITESNRAVLIQFDGALENCIFYISPMYEFSHSQGQSRRFASVTGTSALPPIATKERTSIYVGEGANSGCEQSQQSRAYSITSLARPSRGSGIVRPSALAVLRLMRNSIFVDCWTGRSAGLSPLRMRPV